MSKSSTIIELGHLGRVLDIDPPVHPGEYLLEEYLKPLGVSAGTLATRLRVPRTRIERLVARKTGVTPDTGLRLSKHFGTTPQFWLAFQQNYDLALDAKRMVGELAKIPTFEAA